ncbi:MAG: hypothetical protein AAF430_18250 [Myxococcota bacterium]
MKRRLLTVSETKKARIGGTLAFPTPTLKDIKGPCLVSVELRRPDGTRLPARLELRHYRYSLVYSARLHDLIPEAVPTGTEIWLCVESEPSLRLH